jgi:hypothetical protein
MSGAKDWRWLAVGVIIAVTSGRGVMAQNLSMAPPAAPQPSQGIAVGSPPAQAPGAPAVASQPGCSCGDRRGLSRWRWHRANCKRHLQENFLGYAEEFNEWPLGYALYAHATTQVANGQSARMVFYHYDFIDGSSQLNARGRDKLVKVGTYLPTNFSPVVVERTLKEPGLDESRRLALVSVLGRGSFPIPAERVVIGPSLADGLSGIEEGVIFGNQLQGIASGGGIAGGVAGIGGFVGGGGALDAGGLSGSVVSGGR